jgi:hypothetical protein
MPFFNFTAVSEGRSSRSHFLAAINDAVAQRRIINKKAATAYRVARDGIGYPG